MRKIFKCSLALLLGLFIFGASACSMPSGNDSTKDSTNDSVYSSETDNSENKESSETQSIPEEYKKLFSFTNVTIKVREESNVWLVKIIDDDNVYKIDNLEPTKVNYEEVKYYVDYSSYYKSFQKNDGNYSAYEIPLYDIDGNQYAVGNIYMTLDSGKLNSIQVQWLNEQEEWKYIDISYSNYGTTTLTEDYSSIPEYWKSLFTLSNITVQYETQSTSSFLKANYKIYQVSETEIYKVEGATITQIDPDDYDPIYSIFMLRYSDFESQETQNTSSKFYTAESVNNGQDNYPYENVKITIWDDKISLISYERYIASGLYYSARISFMNYDTTVNPNNAN